MPDIVSVKDLPYEAQQSFVALKGDKVSKNMYRGKENTFPDTIEYIPDGESVEVPTNSFVHLVVGDKSIKKPMRQTHFCAAPATVFGPVLMSIESQAAFDARCPNTPSAREVARDKIMTSICLSGLSLLLFSVMFGILYLLNNNKTELPTQRTGKAFEDTFNVYASKTQGMGEGMVEIMPFILGLTFFFFMSKVLTFFLTSGFSAVEMTRAFPGDLARIMGVDYRKRAQYTLPQSLDVARPHAHHQILNYRNEKSQLTVKKGLKYASLHAPKEDVFVLKDAEVLDVPPHHIVSYWVPYNKEDGSLHSQYWRHVYCQTPATVQGPLIVAMTPSPKPGFKNFICASGEQGSGGFTLLGTVLALSGFSGMIVCTSVWIASLFIKDLVEEPEKLGALFSMGFSFALFSLPFFALGYRQKKIKIKMDSLNA